MVESCRVSLGLPDWSASEAVPVARRIVPAADRRLVAGTGGVVPGPDCPCAASARWRLLELWLDRHVRWVLRRLDCATGEGAAVDVAQPRVVGSGTLRSDRSGSVRSMVVAALMAAGAAALADPPLAVATTAAALTVIVRADVTERRIPTPVVQGAAVVVAAALVSAAATSGEWGRLAGGGLLAAGVAALFTLAWLVEAVGFGDVRLAFMVTMTAGWHGVDVVAALWWWASVAALVGSVAARCRGVRQIALAPAIALGWALAVLPAG